MFGKLEKLKSLSILLDDLPSLFSTRADCHIMHPCERYEFVNRPSGNAYILVSRDLNENHLCHSKSRKS